MAKTACKRRPGNGRPCGAPIPDVQLHLIGALQSNKAAEAVGLFDVIHSLDRPKLAAALARAMAESGRKPRLFVQVNTGDEPQKAGVPVADVAGFVGDCRTQHGLSIEGLMCLPPLGDAAGPHFALLGKLAASLDLAYLSICLLYTSPSPRDNR